MTIVEGQEDPTRKVIGDVRFVSSGYFAVIRIPLLGGDLCRDGCEPLVSW
jgi:hypothetical protein